MCARFSVLMFFLLLNVPGTMLVIGTTGGAEDNGSTPIGTGMRGFAGGNGTADDPFKISDVLQLQDINSNLSAHYVLVNDIDASETKTWNANKGFDPIGERTNGFKGSLNGRGFSISKLWIDRPSENDLGLFSSVRSGWVHHLGISGMEVRGNFYVGTLSGRLSGSRIENVTSEGTIDGQGSYYGGLIGYVEDQASAVQNSSADVGISGSSGSYAYYLGGLIGDNRGMVSNCHSTGDITRTNSMISNFYIWTVGGLIGHNRGAITGCYSSSSLVSEGTPSVYLSRIGGLIGENYGTVKSSSAKAKGGIDFNTITVSNCFYAVSIGGMVGSSYGSLYDCFSETVIDIEAAIGTSYYYPLQRIGGLAGECLWEGEVINCYWNGQIKIVHSTTPPGGSQFYARGLGGLMGYNEKSVSNCRSLGDLVLSGDYLYVGGLIGQNRGAVSRSFSNNPTFKVTVRTYLSDLGGLVGYQEGRDVSDSYFTANPTPMEISGASASVMNIGGLIGNDQYRRVYNCTARGKLSISNVPSVAQVGGLIGNFYEGSMAKSDSSITVEVKGCTGSAYSIGGLVGLGSGKSYDAKMEGCSSSATITVQGSGHLYWIGGLVGYCGVRVSVCHRTGTVEFEGNGVTTPVESVGGLIGCNEKGVTHCSSKGSITFDFKGGTSGTNKVIGMGGLIGWNKDGGYISMSSSTTSIAPKIVGIVDYTIQNAGGLIGDNDGPLDSCYSTGALSINESSSAQSIGGLIGANNGDVKNCYAQRTIHYDQVPSGNGKDIGGLIGLNDASGGMATYCYSVFTAKGTSNIEIGGFIGKNKGTIVSSTYDKDVFKGLGVYNGSSTGLSANTTVQMKKRSTFEPIGWNFKEKWGIIEDRTYPWLFTIYNAPLIEMDHPPETDEDVLLVMKYLITVSPYPSINRVDEIDVQKDADWMYHNAGAKEVSGTPDNGDVGDYWVNISVLDLAGGRAFLNFTIEVKNVNDPPRIITEDILTIIEDEPYSRYYYAVDEDPLQTEMTWTMATNAKWLFFEGNHLHGTPLNFDIGSYWVNVSVRDLEGGLCFSNFTVVVESANDPPVITIDPIAIAFEDVLYSLNLTAEDVDENDRLSWTLKDGPSWLLMTRTQIKGTPGNDDVGMSFVELLVEDLEGASDGIRFIINVKNVNDKPFFIEFPADQNITEGDDLTLQAVARDIDKGDEVLYSISSDPASNISIHSLSGAIEWMDTVPGNYTVLVTASDGNSTVSLDFHLRVNNRTKPEPPVIEENNAPLIGPMEDRTVVAGTTLTVQVAASDEDGDVLFFDLVEAPEGMVISSLGRIVWTPSLVDAGNHTVNVSVSDGNATVFGELNITVTAPPVDDDDDDDDITEPSDDGLRTANAVLIGVAIFLAILSLILTVMVVLLLRRRKGVGEEIEGAGSEGEEEGIKGQERPE